MLKQLILVVNLHLLHKCRMLLPIALIKQLASSMSDCFVVKRSVFNTCLELHPMSEWNVLMGEVNKLNRFVKKNNDFIRLFTAGVKPVEADGNSRLQLPKDLILFAGIQKHVVLSSSVNMIEIWDKAQYEKVLKEASVVFSALAEVVMRGKQNED